MKNIPPRARRAAFIATPRASWLSLAVMLGVFIALFGLFGSSTAPSLNASSAQDSESAKVAALLTEFENADRQSVMVVATANGAGPLSEEQLEGIELLSPVLEPYAADEITGPLTSADGEAALMIVPITTGDSNAETAETIGSIREAIAPVSPDEVTLLVTGGPAFGADIASAFDGADFTLLLVTIIIVAVLLIVTYRSPVLWLIPLVVVALADGLAGRVTAAAGSAWNLQFDAGIISVLVFGAGTNYALLLISRYREELTRHEHHRTALQEAWRATLPAILASNVTVVLSLLTLLLAVIPGTQGLGISSALGLAIALGAVLFLLPPILSLSGRKIFWPFVPHPATSGSSAPAKRNAWRVIATTVSRRPVVSLVAGLGLLGIMTTGLLGTSVGLNQVEKFRVQSESAEGLETLSDHFPAGEAQPIWVVAKTDTTPQVVEAAANVDGIVRAHPVGEPSEAGMVKVMVTSEHVPGTTESLEQIRELREAVHAVPEADALVGGAVATDVDARDGNARDLLVIAPLILAVSFLVLLVLLRSFVAPLLLIVINIASAVAAVGAGAWLSRTLFEQQALDLQVPLLSFLFLVALGIDYTIFLVHRARSEAGTLGTRNAMVEAVTHTGSVITSAGIVLAAVFAALGVLPLVTLGQLGLIVGLGVVIDTLVVRTVIVPAVFSIVGEKVWWPGSPAQKARE
ncbi:MMPL family transporter [Leucobacter chinensis]|uniref:MMPL family transporter n=1 Tax=Leucobacter chinensis TaxID=2851010 RepID=UPI001C210624|nr:MMPL family transporter [Leucobacter chinensis]